MRDRIINNLGANGLFGSHPFLDGKPSAYCARVTSDDVEAYVIQGQRLLEKMGVVTETTRNIISQLVRSSRMLTTQLEMMTFGSSEERVCFFLLHMTERPLEEKDEQNRLLICFTHQEIADLAGLSRVHVSTIISALIKEGIIAKRNGGYRIVREDLLREKIKYYKPD